MDIKLSNYEEFPVVFQAIYLGIIQKFMESFPVKKIAKFSAKFYSSNCRGIVFSQVILDVHLAEVFRSYFKNIAVFIDLLVSYYEYLEIN